MLLEFSNLRNIPNSSIRYFELSEKLRLFVYRLLVSVAEETVTAVYFETSVPECAMYIAFLFSPQAICVL